MAGGEGNGGGGGGTESLATTEPQYVPAKISVWWDIENCHVPRGCSPHLIAKNISSALVKMNYCGPVSINAYGDTTKIGSSIQEALNSTGISLNHVPAGVKDASDKKILVDMLFWAVDNPAPANYLLISGDRDFSNALHQLGMRRYNILLAQPTKASIHLVSAAKNVWLWSSLVTGGPPLVNKEVSQFISNTGESRTEPIQMSQSQDSTVKGTDMMRSNGRSISQPTISNTQNGVSRPQDNHNYGNPNDNRVFSGNLNSGFTSFLPTNHLDANHQGFFKNPYHMSNRPQTFQVQPPPPPPNFIRPLAHVHSAPPVSQRPNTFTFTSGPVKYSSDMNKRTATDHSDNNYRPHVHNGPNSAGPYNQSPNNRPWRSHTSPTSRPYTVQHTAGSENQSTINGPQKVYTGPNMGGSNNQLSSNGPQKVFNVSNTGASNNQLLTNGPHKGFTMSNTAGSNNQLPSNELQKGFYGPNTAGPTTYVASFGPQNSYTEPNTASFNNQSPINGPQVGNAVGSSNQSPINGPQSGYIGPNATGSDNQSTINGPQKDATVPNNAGSNNGSQKHFNVPSSVGSSNQSPSNGPQKGYTGPNSANFNKLSLNGPGKDDTAPNTAGSNNKFPINGVQESSFVPKNPLLFQRKSTSRWCPVGQQNQPPVSSGTSPANVLSNGLSGSSECPAPNEYVQSLIGIVLLALDTLKNEKIMPTEDKIVDCIKYGDPKYRKIDFKKALESAVEQKLIVKQKLGVLQLYAGKDEKLWKCINLIGGNLKEYSENVWREVKNFLLSAAGRDAILATNCRYEAATIIKRECLKELALGEILQILHMVINDKKWILAHHSGWQPLEITFTETNSTPGVGSSFSRSN